MIIRHSNPASQRKVRIRKQIVSRSHRPRLSVFRSNQKMYAQIIDDTKAITLVAVSEKDLAPSQTKAFKKATKTDIARLLGEILAQKALKKKIKRVVFDRGKFKYHGRVKALAQGARKKGLNF